MSVFEPEYDRVCNTVLVLEVVCVTPPVTSSAIKKIAVCSVCLFVCFVLFCFVVFRVRSKYGGGLHCASASIERTDHGAGKGSLHAV